MSSIVCPVGVSTMSMIERLKSVLPGVEDESASVKTFECQTCGETFESAKSPERATCIKCLSDDVEVQ